MAHLSELESSLRELEVAFASARALKGQAEAKLLELKRLTLSLEEETLLLDKVAELFRHLIDREVLDNASIAQDLLTEGLRAIFEDLDLAVRADVEIERGKVAVNLVTIQKHPDGSQTEGVALEACGGSIATVQSVLLRMVVLTKRGMRPFLLLDESLGAVAESYVPRVGQFLSTLATRLGMDILVVTHNPALVDEANLAYRISKKNGEALFTKVGR